jgi:hypothetical protein
LYHRLGLVSLNRYVGKECEIGLGEIKGGVKLIGQIVHVGTLESLHPDIHCGRRVGNLSGTANAVDLPGMLERCLIRLKIEAEK